MGIVFILLITAAGLCVHFLVEGNLAKIILLALIGLLVLVGALAFTFLECIRRAELRRSEMIVKNQNQQIVFPTSSAPEMSNKTSWAYSTPWRYTRGTASTTSTYRAEWFIIIIILCVKKRQKKWCFFLEKVSTWVCKCLFVIINCCWK